MNAVTFHRRRNILKAIVEDDNKTMTMLRETYSTELENSEKYLFGKEFKAKIEKDAKGENKS